MLGFCVPAGRRRGRTCGREGRRPDGQGTWFGIRRGGFMTTRFDPRGAEADSGAGALGVIGTRQLIAAQTFDVARLTSHPVAVIPSSFVAVTGRGPRDSNESGKTSFNAAVALLLGDPEWRVTGCGGGGGGRGRAAGVGRAR